MAQSPNDPVDIAPDQLDPLMWDDLKNPSTVRVGNSESPMATEWKSRNYIPNTQGWMLSSNGEVDGFGGFSGRRYFQLEVFVPQGMVLTGDGRKYCHIPAELDGNTLVEVHARVISVGTTGTTDIQVYNVTQSTDMLSTKLTIDSGELGSNTAATAAVIDTANASVSTNDLISIDVDAVSTIAPNGLIVTLGFE